MDNVIHWINHYPTGDSVFSFVNNYPLDSDLSGEERYPAFELLDPGRVGEVVIGFAIISR